MSEDRDSARWRSLLYVPANRDRFVRSAASTADAVILDLEDAVPADHKAEARAALPDARGDTAYRHRLGHGASQPPVDADDS